MEWHQHTAPSPRASTSQTTWTTLKNYNMIRRACFLPSTLTDPLSFASCIVLYVYNKNLKYSKILYYNGVERESQMSRKRPRLICTSKVNIFWTLLQSHISSTFCTASSMPTLLPTFDFYGIDLPSFDMASRRITITIIIIIGPWRKHQRPPPIYAVEKWACTVSSLVAVSTTLACVPGSQGLGQWANKEGGGYGN